MAWGGGVFTRTYGSTAWQIDASNSVGIVPDRHDTNDQDLADGINACINKAGGNTPTADLPMGGYKHTNLSAGTAAAPTFCAGNDQDTGMYSGGANTLNFATGGVERFRIDSSGHSLCLGILRLGATGGEGGELRIRNAANLDNFILDCGPTDVIRYLNSNNTDQYWENNSVERMRLTAAGNLGIGTNSPSTKLHLGGSADQSIQVNMNGNAAFCGGVNNTAVLSVNRNPITGAITDTGKAAAEINLTSTSTNGVITFLTTSTNNTFPSERMRVTPGGNVGINLTAPNSRLAVGGSTTTTSGAATNPGTFQINESGITAFTSTGGLEFQASSFGAGYGAKLLAMDNGSLAFATRNNAATWSERLRIDAGNGNVGIGNTSPNSLLEVGNGTGQRIVRINGGLTNTAEGAALYIQNGATTNGAFGHYSAIIGGAANATPTIFSGTDTIFYNAAERMRITSGGNVGIGIAAPTSQLHLSTDFALKQTTTTWQTVSDGRIKKNITPYEKGLADILQVNPVNFEYNGKAGTTDGVQGISVIAQEIQPIFPEAVGVTTTKLNEDDEEPTEILNFTTHAITFALINAIKELSTKLDTLTERVEALEA